MARFGVILIFLVVAMFIMTVSAEHNATGEHGHGGLRHPAMSSPTSQQRPGAFASFAKMLIDIPMGIVEAFKDGADVIEGVIITVMRGLF